MLPEISDWQPEITKREHARTDARMVFVFIPLSFAQRHLIVNMKIWGARGGRARRAGGEGGRGAKPRTAPMARRRDGGARGARCEAAHRADGAAARWGHRALPQRDTSVRHGGCEGCEGERSRGTPRVGATRRRALRGYRWRTETPPATLSACATCQVAHRAVARRRAGDIAPYRQAARGRRAWRGGGGRGYQIEPQRTEIGQ